MARINVPKLRIAVAVNQDRKAPQATSIGLVGAVMSGLALVTVAVMLVVLFGFLDALHFGSIADFFSPDSAPAPGTPAPGRGAQGGAPGHALLWGQFRIQ